ncbi:MAG: quinoprotein relay system zinc metallohydrolase 2 [Burkholderiaceae bacterium]
MIDQQLVVCHRSNLREFCGRLIRFLATLMLLVGVTGMRTAQALEPLATTSVAPGVYVHFGRAEISGPGNAGDVANLGFVVGNRCIAVIDTGSTKALGDRLLRSIRQVSPLPVCYVINTHAHPDHILGNQAFVGESSEFVGHRNLARAIATKGPVYLNAIARDLKQLADGTVLVKPTISVDQRTELDLGGRHLIVRAWPVAHTDADVTVQDMQTKTLFLGDLSFAGHLPALDGSLLGWIETTDQLAKLDAQRAVPGHGPMMTAPPWSAILNKQRQYLEALRDDVRAAIRDGKMLSEAVDAVRTGALDKWLLYDEFHQRNVTAAFAELEWE